MWRTFLDSGLAYQKIAAGNEKVARLFGSTCQEKVTLTMASHLGTAPWWERAVPAQAAGEKTSSQVGCSYRTTFSEKCRIEEGKDGKPQRVCTRVLKKYRDCGRGEELTEVMNEDVVDHNYRGAEGNSDLQETFKAPPPPRQVLDADVGEALENFMVYADDLKKEALRENSRNGSRGGLEQERDIAQSQGPLRMERRYRSRGGWFSSWFGFRRQAECSPGRGRPNENLWEDYAKYFQDI